MEIVRYNPKHGYSHVDNGVVRGELRGSSPCMVDVKGYIPMRTQSIVDCFTVVLLMALMIP